MKVIVQNFNYDHCMEIVEQNQVGDEKIKFKIVATNGNCYSHLNVYILNNNGLQSIFTEHDVPGYIDVSYAESTAARLRKSKDNIFAAEDLIKKVFK